MQPGNICNNKNNEVRSNYESRIIASTKFFGLILRESDKTFFDQSKKSGVRFTLKIFQWMKLMFLYQNLTYILNKK